MRKKGRFTKAEILEVEARFMEGQSIYKIGREMKRKQWPIKQHLVKLGLLEDDISNHLKIHNSDFSYKFYDPFVLGFLIAHIPNLYIAVFIYLIYLLPRL